jgi:hypothetical protein
VVPFYVETILSWVFSIIKLQYISMNNFVEKSVSEEGCSAYVCFTYAIKLLIMFAMILSPIFGIHNFIILKLFASQFCYINFCCMTRLANMILVP